MRAWCGRNGQNLSFCMPREIDQSLELSSSASGLGLPHPESGTLSPRFGNITRPLSLNHDIIPNSLPNGPFRSFPRFWPLHVHSFGSLLSRRGVPLCVHPWYDTVRLVEAKQIFSKPHICTRSRTAARYYSRMFGRLQT